MLLQGPTLSVCAQYRPRKLDKFVIHKDIGDNLAKLVRVSPA